MKFGLFHIAAICYITD